MTAASHPLDNPALSALLGPQAHLAERHGRVLRYPAEVSPWVAFDDEPDHQTWSDAAALAGPGGRVSLAGIEGSPPPGWETLIAVPGLQMVGERVLGDGVVDERAIGEGVTGEGAAAEAGGGTIRLGPDDVPEMLELVARTEPGPFLARTIELGAYLGIRRDGRLAAMAGERMRPPGWTEISAVCTDPAYRGQGLASRLVHAVSAGIRARGETPFLHAAATNSGAVRLYEALGFRPRRELTFRALRVPDPLT